MTTLPTRSLGHLDPLGIDVFDQLEAPLLHDAVTKLDHLAELPRRVDVHQRERGLRGIEGLHGDMQHRHRILADGEQHHRLLAFGDSLAHDVDALRLQPVEMTEGACRKRCHSKASEAF